MSHWTLNWIMLCMSLAVVYHFVSVIVGCFLSTLFADHSMLNFALLSQIMRPRKFNPSESAFDRILANAADVSRGDRPVPVPVPKTKEEFNMLYLHQVLEGNYDSVCRGEEGWNGGHVQWLVWMARMPVVPFQSVFHRDDAFISRLDNAANDDNRRF
jgi:hypothetical protein